MKPVQPTSIVWHPNAGERVVIGAEGNEELVQQGKELEEVNGPGTWTISLECHMLAIHQQLIGGVTQIVEEPLWFKWSDLSRIGAG